MLKIKENWKSIQHKKLWVDSMIGMTWGFIASLVVGSIIGLFGINQDNDWSRLTKQTKEALSYITPFAIGVGVGIKLEMKPIQILAIGIGAFIIAHSLLIPKMVMVPDSSSVPNPADSWINWTSAKFGIESPSPAKPGDVFAAWLISVAFVYLFKTIVWDTFIDIILVPIFGFFIGVLGSVTLTYPTSTILVLLEWVINHTIMDSHIAAIFLAFILGALMGAALSLPTSSAAIAFALSLKGDAATAAMAATAAQMISFGVMTYLATNKIGLSVAVGFGTTMIQMKNFTRKPIMLLIPVIISGLVAMIAVAALPLDYPYPKPPEKDVVSGMGTSGLYGPIFTLQFNGWENYQAWLSVLLMQLVIPALLGIVAYYGATKFNLIKKDDYNVNA